MTILKAPRPSTIQVIPIARIKTDAVMLKPIDKIRGVLIPRQGGATVKVTAQPGKHQTDTGRPLHKRPDDSSSNGACGPSGWCERMRWRTSDVHWGGLATKVLLLS